MEHYTNKLLRAYFLDDDNAWEELSDLWTNRMIRKLNYRFGNLPDTERDEIVPNFQIKFVTNVDAAREEAAREISASSRELSRIEIEATKIKWCSIKTKFDLSHGSKFEAWMWTCIRNAALSALKRLKIPFDSTIDHDYEDAAFDAYEQLYEFQTPPDQGGLNDADDIERFVREALKGNELIYCDLWFNSMKEGLHSLPDPKASEVIAAVTAQTRISISNSAVTQLKQRFIVKAYLAIIERLRNANSAAGLFRRLSEMNGNRGLVSEIMMENIWDSFYKDETAVQKSRTELSRALWVEWDSMTLKKKGVQEKILVKAYRYFRRLKPCREFCSRIELYADNSFGGRIRDIFMKGGGEDNGE